MAEMVNKCDVVNRLIRLENNYQFYKEQWDADVLYRRICELELSIAKMPGVDVVRCEKCHHYNAENQYCGFWGGSRHPGHYCGEGVGNGK